MFIGDYNQLTNKTNCNFSAFRTSTPEKLYYALRRFADDKIDVGAMMDTWTRQAGYPLVTVQVHADRRNVSISQSRFFLKNRGTNHTNKWDIPLNWATSWDNANFNRTDRQFILSKSDNSLEVELISKTDWIIFNVQQTGILTVAVKVYANHAPIKPSIMYISVPFLLANRFLSCQL